MNDSHRQDTTASLLGASRCTYAIEPPCTERYARWCERSGLLSPSYSILQHFLVIDCLDTADKFGPSTRSNNHCFTDAIIFQYDRHGIEVTLITEIGPVIGSHVGPGTIALESTDNG